MIKQAKSDTIKTITTAASLDRILADLDAGVTVPPAQLRKAIVDARNGLDMPSHYLSATDRATEVIDAVQAAQDPLQYARSSLDQDFFGNAFLPHEMRRLIAVYLWGAFGERGNPIWKNYLDGTFKYLNIEQFQEDDV